MTDSVTESKASPFLPPTSLTLPSQVALQAQKTLFFLHGAGETAEDYIRRFGDAPATNPKSLPRSPHIKIIAVQSELQ